MVLAALTLTVYLCYRVHKLEVVVVSMRGEMERGDAGRTAYMSLTSDSGTGQPLPPPRPSCSTPKTRRSADQLMLDEAERFLGESIV